MCRTSLSPRPLSAPPGVFCFVLWVVIVRRPGAKTHQGGRERGVGTRRSHFGNVHGGDSTEIVRHRPPPFPSPHLARSDSRSLGLRCRSARPPGPPAPDHCQAGARAKRPVPAPCRSSAGLGACGAPASRSQCRARDAEVLTRRNPLRLVAVALEEDACSSSRRSPLRLVAVALEEDAALATHPAAPVPPVGHPGAGRRAPLCPVTP